MIQKKLLTILIKFRNKFPRSTYLATMVFLALLSPIDYISRFLNGTSDRPPLLIRRQVGPLSEQEQHTAEFVAYLKLLCKLSPTTRVLDIGCGYGLLAIHLKGFFIEPGGYVGLDINKNTINWARNHIAVNNPRIQFKHIDVWNSIYNPKGKCLASNIRLELDDHSFDIILLKSVFTHMCYDDVFNYLNNISRLLSPDGICLTTFFLINEEREALRSKGLNSPNFEITDSPCYYVNQELPELAVAFNEMQLRGMISETNFEINNIFYGNWSGRGDSLSFQDIVLIKQKVVSE